MKILGIETSADEASAAIVEDGYKLLSNAIGSSIDITREYGGIVPEIVARSHLETIIPIIKQSFRDADLSWDDIDAIAVTQGPGLIGSLLIGVMTAKTLALAKNKPLFPVNHVEAHVYANFITETKLPGYSLNGTTPAFPVLALIVSGGHTQLVLFKDHHDYQMLGQTRDDAVGEAYDKVAKITGLPYPGGPSVSEAAESGDPDAVKLPISKLDNPYDFSFSGLKTAVLRAAQAQVGQDYTFPSGSLPELLSKAQVADLCASFQKTAIKTLVDATAKAVNQYHPASLVVGGGVAANTELRRQLQANLRLKPIYNDIKLCTDNAAMIASLAYFLSKQSKPHDTTTLSPLPNWEM